MFPLPDLSDLPGWAQVLAYFVLAVSLGVIVLVGRSGFLRGKAADPADKQGHAEIAMVAIDSDAVKQLAAAAEALNMTLIQMNGMAGQYLDDLRVQRDEAEIEAAERRGYDRAVSERPSRRVTPRRKPVKKSPTSR
jgi:hypothetical protein